MILGFARGRVDIYSIICYIHDEVAWDMNLIGTYLLLAGVQFIAPIHQLISVLSACWGRLPVSEVCYET